MSPGVEQLRTGVDERPRPLCKYRIPGSVQPPDFQQYARFGEEAD